MEHPASPISITWIGHATVLIEVDGFRILTDPALTVRLAHLRRRIPVPVIAPVDAVLISHVHMDHPHTRSLRTVASGTRLVVPDGAGSLVSSLASGSLDQVRSGGRLLMRPHAHHSPAIEVEVVHAHHFRRRGPHSRIDAPPVGYVIRVGKRAIYFAGDTDLFDEMRHLGPLDVALLPIWGWGPTLGERHLDPSSATTATRWLDPRIVVPIHWGTYSPRRARPGSPQWLNNPLGAFRSALRGDDLEDRLVAIQPGGSLVLD